MSDHKSTLPLITLVVFLLTVPFIFLPKTAIAQPQSEREWYHLVSGYYSAEDGWKTFQESKASMGLPIPYSYETFVRLPISKIDSLAREALNKKLQYVNYCAAMRSLEMIPQRDAYKKASQDKQEELAERSEASAAMWPEYKENMIANGQNFHSGKEFYNLSLREQEKLLNESDGTDRSFWQWVKQDYSADDGWKVYQSSLSDMKISPAYQKFQFIQLSIEKINELAIHAKESNDIFSEYRELCRLAHVPLPYTALEIYQSPDLSPWKSSLDKATDSLAARITYAESCKEVDWTPDWKVFESKTEDEQVEIAFYAQAIAKNWSEYKALCDKFSYEPDVNFQGLSIDAQKAKVQSLSDELWASRREKVFTATKIIVVTAVAILLTKKAYDAQQSNSPYGNLEDPANIAPGKQFSQDQKRRMLEQNRRTNNGTIRSDETGQRGYQPKQHIKGVTPRANEVHIDHIIPRSKGGTNSYKNAQVLLRSENLKKGAK